MTPGMKRKVRETVKLMKSRLEAETKAAQEKQMEKDAALQREQILLLGDVLGLSIIEGLEITADGKSAHPSFPVYIVKSDGKRQKSRCLVNIRENAVGQFLLTFGISGCPQSDIVFFALDPETREQRFLEFIGRHFNF